MEWNDMEIECIYMIRKNRPPPSKKKPSKILNKKLGKGIGVVAIKKNPSWFFFFSLFQIHYLTLNGHSSFKDGTQFSFELLNALVASSTPVRLSSSWKSYIFIMLDPALTLRKYMVR